MAYAHTAKAHAEPTLKVPTDLPGELLGFGTNTLYGVASLVWSILVIATLAWFTGVGHWCLMTAYNSLGCYSFTWVGMFTSPFAQARPECVLIWRLAEVSHWSLFDLFGRILTMLVPSA